MCVFFKFYIKVAVTLRAYRYYVRLETCDKFVRFARSKLRPNPKPIHYPFLHYYQFTSPSKVKTRRSTPWAAGCWGPKFSVMFCTTFSRTSAFSVTPRNKHKDSVSHCLVVKLSAKILIDTADCAPIVIVQICMFHFLFAKNSIPNSSTYSFIMHYYQNRR